MHVKLYEYGLMYTGYYAQVKKYESRGLFPISISYTTPYCFKYLPNYKPLVPNGYLLKLYKDQCIDEDEYINMYTVQLDDLSRYSVIKDLFSLSCGKSPILCCYEKSFEFCHRNLVCDWLNNSYMVSCMEYF